MEKEQVGEGLQNKQPAGWLQKAGKPLKEMLKWIIKLFINKAVDALIKKAVELLMGALFTAVPPAVPVDGLPARMEAAPAKIELALPAPKQTMAAAAQAPFVLDKRFPARTYVVPLAVPKQKAMSMLAR